MAILAPDDFAGTGAISANWEAAYDSGTGAATTAWARSGGTVVPGDPTTHDTTERYTGITWPANHWSEIKIASVGINGSGQGIGVQVRASGNVSLNCYRAVFGPSGPPAMEYGKFVAGVFSPLGNDPGAFADGDFGSISANGTTITVKKNANTPDNSGGTTVGTTTDPAISAAGCAAMGVSSSTGGTGDSWAGGDFTSASSGTAIIQSSYRPRQLRRPLPYLLWSNAPPLTNTEFAFPVYPPSRQLGPQVLRRAPPYTPYDNRAPITDTNFVLPTYQVGGNTGPMVLRRHHQYIPLGDLAPTSNTEFVFPTYRSYTAGPQVLRRLPPYLLFDVQSAPSNALSASVSITFDGAAGLTATGTLAATTAITFSGTASISAVGTLAATATIVVDGSASLTATGALAAAPAILFGGSASLMAVGALAVSAPIVFGGATALTAVGSLAATAVIVFDASASLTSSSANDMSATVGILFGGSADINAIGTLAALVPITFSGLASLTDASGAASGIVGGAWLPDDWRRRLLDEDRVLIEFLQRLHEGRDGDS